MDWVQLISNYGFPIVVSLYLLVKTQQKLEEVSTLLVRISESMQHATSLQQLPPTTSKRRSGHGSQQ